MALFTTSKPKISVKSLARFPVRVTAADGVKVVKSNGVYNFSLDVPGLTENSSVADSSEWRTVVYNESTEDYESLLLSELYQRQRAVNSVAQLQASRFDSQTQIVHVLGRTTPGVGGFRVAYAGTSQPSNPERYQSADGKWWTRVVEPYGLSFKSFGFSGSAADNLSYFTGLQNYAKYLYDTYGAFHPRIFIEPDADAYYFSDTMQWKYLMWWEGTAGGFAGGENLPKFLIAPKKGAIVINGANTLGPTYVADSGYPGAARSIIRGISFEQVEAGNKPLIPWAFGIWVKVRAEITDCSFTNYGNHPIAVMATSGDGSEVEGNANGSRIERIRVVNSPAAAVYFWGADANAGRTSALDVARCPYAVRDDSFLGNTHYDPQWESFSFDIIENWNCAAKVLKNGYFHIIRQGETNEDDTFVAGAHINPPEGDGTHNTYWVCVDDGAEEDDSTATWGRVQDDDGLVYDAQPGQYANMWTTQPKTNATVWGTGSAPTPGVVYIQWAQASAMVNKTGDWANAPFNIGPYVQAGGYRLASAWPLLVSPYQEGEYQTAHITSNFAEVVAGNLGYGPDTPVKFRSGKGIIIPPCTVAQLPTDAAVGTRGFVTDADVDYDSTVIGQAPVGGDNGECPVVKLTSGWVIG
jgi:hypothetical protein